MGHATPRRRSAVPLTGADCFLRAFDGEIRRYHGASHVSQLVLRLGPGFDLDGFRQIVGDVARDQPIVRAPIRRRMALGPPAYLLSAAAQCAPPRVEVHECDDEGAFPGLPDVFQRRLNEPFDARRGELLRFDVVRRKRGAAGTDLAVSWLHMLFDGSGSERFIAWLDSCRRGDRRSAQLPIADELQRVEPDRATLRARGEGALAWQRWLDGFAARPPRSLAGPLRRTRQRLEYDVLGLSPRETARAVESAGRHAGLFTPMLFYLAAALRAHHAVFRAQGVLAKSYLVPLPVNTRPRGPEGAMFRTQVSLLWFQVEPAQVEDFGELVASLKEQRLAAVRAGHVENGVHAMDVARFVPGRLAAHLARRGMGGELCSFFFAFTGEFLQGLKRFFGAELLDGFHVAPVPPSPGSCLAICLRNGRLNATHVRQQAVFSPQELAIFREQLHADLTS